MKLKYQNPKAEGSVVSYNQTVKHGDVVDSEVWGVNEKQVIKKALKSPYWVEAEEKKVAKKKVASPEKEG
jgi:hypothetical protein